MKKILITGKNSYVGNSLKKWLENYPGKYIIDTISLRDDYWKKRDFSCYDVVIHVAGIAHIKETKKNAELYYLVNRDLAFETAKKAKIDGVKQFIFLSSMSVYGIKSGVIDKDSPLNPISNYGKSKLQAENLIKNIEADNFKVAILRPPMIYGGGCKGNYQRLANIALMLPFFPDINNKRSMIFIDNLCKIVKLIIDKQEKGLFFPQNNEYVKTSKMVELIAMYHGKKIRRTKLFNPLVSILKINDTVVKVFGDLVYDQSLSKFEECKTVSLEESIRITES